MTGTAERRRSPLLLALAGVATLSAFALLMALGTWQVQRLHWKEGLLSTIEARIGQPARPLAEVVPLAQSAGAIEYMPVSVEGTFLHEHEMFMLATHGGQSGWYVYTPMSLGPGSFIVVNRGFVPYDRRDPASRPGSQPDGVVEIAGLARERLDAKPGFLVPDNRPEEGTYYWKDWAAMVASADLDAAQTLPFFVDAGATPRDTLPVGGVTIVNLPNNHLQYAVTWYGLAATLVVIVVVYGWRRRSARP